MGRASVPTPTLYPAFFFVLEKAAKSAGNAVIPTFPTHWSHGLQHLRRKQPTFAFTSESGYTLGSLRKIAHSGSQGETGVLWMGALSLPSDRFARSGNPAWPEGRTAYFAPLGSWPRVLPKNAESLRNSDALMRVAVPKASRPRWAALLCLQFGDVAVFSLCAQGFPHMRKRGWYHYPRCALCASEMPDGRLSKGLICRFLRLGSLH